MPDATVMVRMPPTGSPVSGTRSAAIVAATIRSAVAARSVAVAGAAALAFRRRRHAARPPVQLRRSAAAVARAGRRATEPRLRADQGARHAFERFLQPERHGVSGAHVSRRSRLRRVASGRQPQALCADRRRPRASRRANASTRCSRVSRTSPARWNSCAARSPGNRRATKRRTSPGRLPEFVEARLALKRALLLKAPPTPTNSAASPPSCARAT